MNIWNSPFNMCVLEVNNVIEINYPSLEKLALSHGQNVIPMPKNDASVSS